MKGLENPVVITGIGLLTPLGADVSEQVQRVVRGESGISSLCRPELEGHFCVVGGTVPQFDLTPKLRQPKNEKLMSRSVSIAVFAAIEAVKCSGIPLPYSDPSRVALHVGSGQTGLEIDEFYKALSLAWPDGVEHDWKYLDMRASRMIDRYFSLRTLSNAGLALISSELGIQGPSANYVQSETASANALESCFWDLVEDRCDVALAGGYECLLRPSLLMAYGNEGLLTRHEGPNAYRPFDVQRDGIALSEGAAFLVMERKNDAERRGSTILGEIHEIITATSSGPNPAAQPDQQVTGHVIEAALKRTGNPDFAVARGFGTQLADAGEAEMLAKILPRGTPVTGFKGHTGYLGAATALTELSLGLLAVRQGVLPPVAGLETPDGFDIDLVIGQPRPITGEALRGFFLNHSMGGSSTAIVASVSSAQA